jgi:predicted flap endonuclease-1-like 5' DNA nuclease
MAPGPPAFPDDSGADATMTREGTAGARAAETGPDDLTAIDGIGPKTSAILLESGITSFDELAACDLYTLKRLLIDASIAANADTWPEQVRVAASGDLVALDALQARLRNSR